MDPIAQPSKESDSEAPSAEPSLVVASSSPQDNTCRQIISVSQEQKTEKKNAFGAKINTLLIIICILLPFVGWAIGSLINPQGKDSHEPSMTLIYMAFFPLVIVSQPILLIPLILGLAVIFRLFRRQFGKMFFSILLLISVLASAATCYFVSIAPTQEEG